MVLIVLGIFLVLWLLIGSVLVFRYGDRLFMMVKLVLLDNSGVFLVFVLILFILMFGVLLVIWIDLIIGSDVVFLFGIDGYLVLK